MYLSSLVLLPSPDTTEVITIITQKRKGRSSIYKTIFHLHVCMTYFCFIKYKNLSNWKLLFQLSRAPTDESVDAFFISLFLTDIVRSHHIPAGPSGRGSIHALLRCSNRCRSRRHTLRGGDCRCPESVMIAPGATVWSQVSPLDV